MQHTLDISICFYTSVEVDFNCCSVCFVCTLLPRLLDADMVDVLYAERACRIDEDVCVASCSARRLYQRRRHAKSPVNSDEGNVSLPSRPCSMHFDRQRMVFSVVVMPRLWTALSTTPWKGFSSPIERLAFVSVTLMRSPWLFTALMCNGCRTLWRLSTCVGLVLRDRTLSIVLQVSAPFLRDFDLQYRS